MKAAIIVAHPDDEIIWSGGLILQRPEWDWVVLSLSRADDADRCPKFHRVCDLLGVKGYISDLDDSDPPKPINRRREIGNRIMECLTLVPCDLCITHGSNGEYGQAVKLQSPHRWPGRGTTWWNPTEPLVRCAIRACPERQPHPEQSPAGFAGNASTVSGRERACRCWTFWTYWVCPCL